MSRWFRFYDDAINDPKILKLSDELYRAWVGILCVASKYDGVLPPNEDVALMLRVKPQKAAEYITRLVRAGLLDEIETGFAPHNWDKRQYKSDVSTERVKRFRNAGRNVSPTVSETPPETDTDTKPEEEKKEAIGSAKRRTRYSDDFENRFWKLYPRTPLMSKKEALREWEKLDSEDQEKAIAAVPLYVAFLKSKPDHPAVHGCRFLSQRRFEGFGEPQEAPAGNVGFAILPGTEQFLAWWRANPDGSFQKSLMVRAEDTGQPYYAKSEWPPNPHEAAA